MEGEKNQIWKQNPKQTITLHKKQTEQHKQQQQQQQQKTTHTAPPCERHIFIFLSFDYLLIY